TDLCWRAWRRGWRTIYVPEALLYHKVGMSGDEYQHLIRGVAPGQVPRTWFRRRVSYHTNLLRFALKVLPARDPTRLAAAARRRGMAREPAQPQACPRHRARLRPQRAPASRHAGRAPARGRGDAPRSHGARAEVRSIMIASPVLVTGGAGFIGSHLVEALLPRGAPGRALESPDPPRHGTGANRGRPPPAPAAL